MSAVPDAGRGSGPEERRAEGDALHAAHDRRPRRAERVVTDLFVPNRLDRGATTVGAVAVGLGFLHMGRFAAAYRDAFGESPSDTLNRPA